MRTKILLPFFLILFLLNSQHLPAQPGALDPDFGNNGVLTTDVHWSPNFKIQSDGKLILGGLKYVSSPTNSDMLIGRLLENGLVDSSFGEYGKTRIDFNDLTTESSALEDFSDAIILDDGRIVAAGLKDSYSAVNRGKLIVAVLHPNGVIDTSFGNLGRHLFEFDGFTVRYTGVEKFSDGDFLLWASLRIKDSSDYSHIALIRFNSDGSFDPSFGPNGDGIIVKEVGPASPFIGGTRRIYVKIGPDDKIVLTGTANPYEIATNRYNPDGSDDLSYGVSGQTLTYVGLYVQVEDLAIQPDYKILIWGHSRFAGDPVFTIVRLNADGSNDNSWEDDGILLQDVGDYDNEINAGVLQKDGKVVAVGTRILSDGSSQWIIARYNTNGTPDTGFGLDGLQGNDFGPEEETPYGVEIGPDHGIFVSGKFSAAGAPFWLLAKYNAGEYVSIKNVKQANALQASLTPNLIGQGQSIILRYELLNSGPVSAQLIDSKGATVQSFFLEEQQGMGQQSKELQVAEQLPGGLYRLNLKIAKSQITLPVLLKR